MSDFIFKISPNVILGSYSVNRLGQYLLEWGTRFMIIMDPILNEVKLADKITKALDDRKIGYFIFNEITDGSNTKNIQRALSLAKEGHIQGVIGIGGTKALNISRTVSALYNEVHDLYTFVDGAVPITNPLPCVCIPTTFRTPYIFTSEIPFTDSRSNEVKLLKIQNSVCKLLLIDTNMMVTLTENQKATLSIEVLCMAIEAYISQKANFFSDMFVEKGLELLSYAMNGSNSLDITTPEEELLSQAGCLISLAASSSSLGLSTLLALSINSKYRLNKSLVASILLPYAMEDAAKFKSAKLEKLAHLMKIIPENEEKDEAINSFIDYVRQYMAKANLPTRLKDLQLTIEQLSLCVENISKVDIFSKLPRSMSTDELFDFIKTAY